VDIPTNRPAALTNSKLLEMVMARVGLSHSVLLQYVRITLGLYRALNCTHRAVSLRQHGFVVSCCEGRNASCDMDRCFPVHCYERRNAGHCD